MIDSETKAATRGRLRIIAGQARAVERMVEAERCCIRLPHQLDAVQVAIGKAGEFILRSHLKTWVTNAIREDDERELTRRDPELVAVSARARQQTSWDSKPSAGWALQSYTYWHVSGVSHEG